MVQLHSKKQRQKTSWKMATTFIPFKKNTMIGVMVMFLLTIDASAAQQQQQRNNRPHRPRQFWSPLPAIYYDSYPFSAYPSYSFYELLESAVEAPFNTLYQGKQL